MTDQTIIETSPDTATRATKPAERQRLTGSLGVWGIVFIVVAAASPLGVIGGPVPLGIGLGNGAGLPTAFAVSTVILLLFAVGFTALTPYVPNAGAFYSYIGKGLGRVTGLGFAFVALISYLALEIGVYGLIGQGAKALVESWGFPQLHWAVWALVAFAVVSVLGHRNIDLSRTVLGVLLIAEVAIVLVLDAVIVGKGGDHGLSTGFASIHTVLSGAPGIALLFAILSFVGFEATAVFRDEARDPDRTIPRATYLSLGLIGVFYAVSTWALLSGWGDDTAVAKAQSTPDTLLAQTTERYLGAVGGHIIQVLFVTSLFACILSFHNIGSRYVFTLAQRSALPSHVGRPHQHHGSPHLASAAVSVVVGVFLIIGVLADLDPVTQLYTWFAGVSTVGIVTLLLATSIAVPLFFARRRREGELTVPASRALVAPSLAVLGLTGVLILILANLPSLVGDSTAIAVGVVALLAATFAAGAALAWQRPQIVVD
ncbi:APC family permease [Gordonia asplenii]|uniref:APC family permease n=1 Tax=Gordonia asplenii TaxID=2725283 RepID=UPI0028ABCEBA|nr:APC family permease [Gordonia asplenii]